MKIELDYKEIMLIDSAINREIEIWENVLLVDEKGFCKSIAENRETLMKIKEKLWGKERKKDD